MTIHKGQETESQGNVEPRDTWIALTDKEARRQISQVLCGCNSDFNCLFDDSSSDEEEEDKEEDHADEKVVEADAAADIKVTATPEEEYFNKNKPKSKKARKEITKNKIPNKKDEEVNAFVEEEVNNSAELSTFQKLLNIQREVFANAIKSELNRIKEDEADKADGDEEVHHSYDDEDVASQPVSDTSAAKAKANRHDTSNSKHSKQEPNDLEQTQEQSDEHSQDSDHRLLPNSHLQTSEKACPAQNSAWYEFKKQKRESKSKFRKKLVNPSTNGHKGIPLLTGTSVMSQPPSLGSLPETSGPNPSAEDFVDAVRKMKMMADLKPFANKSNGKNERVKVSST
eukprot:CAMPEP_0195513978 /NCGR_PEP_ID=MMETSP0794_2-20130614/5510_1 /TAXON_ID=515487 /ORGANISM="Stephanopyxis turris, Strain CCMP 815" /LENGTH=341 /DNA_ID=CAMNT_0040642129 /DNA_START=147 /DNA_END=1172 /DNA_ORIENTATION=+